MTMRCRLSIVVITLLLCSPFLCADSPAAPPAVDPALWKRMVEIDTIGGRIKDATADFEQRKFTPLLKKPLISTGTIRVRGGAMRWDTKIPEPSIMRIDEKEIRLYYPSQTTMEIYAIDQQLGSLASSPLPRLSVLKQYFTFEQISAKDLSPDADPTSCLALKLTPIDSLLREHIESVRVLLDAKTGFTLRTETTDSDGDRTSIIFSKIRMNIDLTDQDVQLNVPAGTKIMRPLDGMNGQPPKRNRDKAK